MNRLILLYILLAIGIIAIVAGVLLGFVFEL